MEQAGTGQRKLQCGYHAWTYALDGALISAPNLSQMPDVDRSQFGLIRVHLREWLGYVWLCIAEEPPSFEDTVIGAVAERLGAADDIELWGIDRLEVGKRITYDVNANWKLIVENFMECYHCATIHPELVEVLPEFAEGYAAQYFVGHGAEFGENVAGFTVDGTEGVAAIPGVDEEHDRKYYAITVNPQVFINLVPDHVIFHRMFPVALFHRVNEQDFDAAERCQLAAGSKGYAKGGVLVPTEHHIGLFHEWVTRQLDTAQPIGADTR